MKTCNNNLTGFFMEPQNFSVNDGDGIRTIIFFAGCPLKCQWCANPEGQNINNCLVKEYSIEQLLKIIERQEVFFRNSKGGVTFSGGEATLNQEILRELTNILYDKAINLAIETSGYFNFHEIKDIFKKMDLIFVDIKHMDESKHNYFTGKSNKVILNNIIKMDELNVPIVVRIPLIEGVNTDKSNIVETTKFVKDNIKNPKIELLPYHNFGDEKYKALGLKKPPKDFKTPSAERLKELEEIIQEIGVEVVSYK